jgi:hypothetical protein
MADANRKYEFLSVCFIIIHSFVSLFIQEVTVTEKGEERKICKKVEEDRELMGVARVGELAKGLLLTGTAFKFIGQCC